MQAEPSLNHQVSLLIPQPLHNLQKESQLTNKHLHHPKKCTKNNKPPIVIDVVTPRKKVKYYSHECEGNVVTTNGLQGTSIAYKIRFISIDAKIEDPGPIYDRTTIRDVSPKTIDTVLNEIIDNGCNALKTTSSVNHITELPNCRAVLKVSIWKNVACKITDDIVLSLLSRLTLQLFV